MKIRPFAHSVFGAFFWMTSLIAFGAGQSLEDPFQSILTALDRHDYEKISILLPQISSGSFSVPATSTILRRVLKRALLSAPSELHHESAIKILRLFCTDQGIRFSSDIPPYSISFNVSHQLPRRDVVHFLDAIRFVLTFDSPYKEEVLGILFQNYPSHLLPNVEGLWLAANLNSDHLANIIVERIPNFDPKSADSNHAFDEALSKPTLNLKLLSLMIEKGIGKGHVPAVKRALPQIFENDDFARLLTESDLDEAGPTKFSVTEELMGYYANAFQSVNEDEISQNDLISSKQIRRLLVRFLVGRGCYSNTDLFSRTIQAASKKGDDLVLKLLSRKLPQVWLGQAEEYLNPDGEVMVSISYAPHPTQYGITRELYKRVMINHKLYKKKQREIQLIQAGDRVTDKEVEEINGFFKDRIQSRGAGLVSFPKEASEYPVQLITRKDVIQKSLTYRAARALLEEDERLLKECLNQKDRL